MPTVPVNTDTVLGKLKKLVALGLRQSIVQILGDQLECLHWLH
jgi:hypothetical protein